jgi:hypothetical protein
MRDPVLMAMAGITFLALLAAGCTAPAQGGTAPPVVTDLSPAGCGFTSCHGLDLACGQPPQACTATYQLGDRCRQYAYCTNANGSCTLVRTAAFDTCKSCMDRCGGADSTEILTCEEKC